MSTTRTIARRFAMIRRSADRRDRHRRHRPRRIAAYGKPATRHEHDHEHVHAPIEPSNRWLDGLKAKHAPVLRCPDA